jgi:hypothetical protein
MIIQDHRGVEHEDLAGRFLFPGHVECFGQR